MCTERAARNLTYVKLLDRNGGPFARIIDPAIKTLPSLQNMPNIFFFGFAGAAAPFSPLSCATVGAL